MPNTLTLNIKTAVEIIFIVFGYDAVLGNYHIPDDERMRYVLS